MPTLEEWLECRGLPVAKCNAYRSRRGLPLLEDSEQAVTEQRPVQTAVVRPRTETPPRLPMPSLLQRVRTFMVAAHRHQAAGAPMCDDVQLEARLNICQSCEQFDGQHCRVCGCRCGAGQNYFNKLAWADASCPHPSGAKWEAAAKSRDNRVPKVC